ncbi:nuclear pore complex protein Nup88 [Trichonephila clavata]|uniref:Nuclear pore complex protein Nup88 n=1 Tax=Trichonephila clavata TaxID=2740835 RepID=A0A8X6K934_TRICU|nr:nuclear pore complex protein Nup88 [Trichonephila clavata]
MASAIDNVLKKSGLLEKLCMNQKKYYNIKESKNLVAIFEQHIFVWDDAGSCVITAELNTSEVKESTCMKLTLTNPPVFDVESILFNQTGSLLALSGKHGVMIFAVPWRYGKFSSAGNNRKNVIGRSWNVAEYFFVCSSKVSVIQVAWHPGSPSNTHLTVLSSDNYIRTYDITEPQTPQQVIALNPNSKNSFLSSESKISFSTCFGENSVSFDFGPAEEMQVVCANSSRVSKSYEQVTIWPIYLLHGNGDIYVLKSPLIKDRSQPAAKVIGPLAMYPASEDNYGYDACYILCLHTVPTCLVVATATGIIYHCIVLENSNSSSKEKLDDTSWGLDSTTDDSEIALYVFESVELSLSLNEEPDDVYSHPIRLYKDITSRSKYHGTHASGLHSVAMPFLQALENSLETETFEKLLSDETKQTCIVEHTICTKPFSQVDSVPVLGFDVIINDVGVTMICLLASWESVCLPLVSSYFSSVPQLLLQNKYLSKEDDKSSISAFGQQIEKSLQRSMCCPYLKSNLPVGHNNPSPQQWLDLLCNVTQRFREDYVQRLSTAQALLRSRIKVLVQQKEYQLQDICKTEEEKEKLIREAEKLAEKYEDANANQQKILKRIETVLQKFQKNLPYLSNPEINMKETLLSYEEKLKVFETSLDQIKKKLKHQKEKRKDFIDGISMAKSDTTNLNLTETQMKHVKELLQQEGESISELMKAVTTIKKQIGL